ncbi:MAG: 23S rRNA (pseudouridine(1915)-N(3))-methyltransferase RlmH [Candidatus Aminicenantes bacterium]|nr:23S rRNA (pseudouridine(1915)-N(3))-methyltransferase RlmH [Candidatus Aminicenantes bacterium]
MSSAELALSRVMLLEQIYRSLMIIKGRQYAK